MTKALILMTLFALLIIWPDPNTTANKIYVNKDANESMIQYEKVKGQVLDLTFQKKFDTSKILLKKINKKN